MKYEHFSLTIAFKSTYDMIEDLSRFDVEKVEASIIKIKEYLNGLSDYDELCSVDLTVKVVDTKYVIVCHANAAQGVAEFSRLLID